MVLGSCLKSLFRFCRFLTFLTGITHLLLNYNAKKSGFKPFKMDEEMMSSRSIK